MVPIDRHAIAWASAAFARRVGPPVGAAGSSPIAVSYCLDVLCISLPCPLPLSDTLPSPISLLMLLFPCRTAPALSVYLLCSVYVWCHVPPYMFPAVAVAYSSASPRPVCWVSAAPLPPPPVVCTYTCALCGEAPSTPVAASGSSAYIYAAVQGGRVRSYCSAQPSWCASGLATCLLLECT